MSTAADHAANIRAAREAHDWSQTDLAKRMTSLGVQINQSAVSRIEKCERPPRFNEVRAMANLFGVSLEAMGLPAERFEGLLEERRVVIAYHQALEALPKAASRYTEARARLETFASAHPEYLPKATELLQSLPADPAEVLQMKEGAEQ